MEQERNKSTISEFSGDIYLTPQEKLALISLLHTPGIQALWKLMEAEIITARNEAMEVDPADEKAQRAKLTIAYSQNKFYRAIRAKLQFITQEALHEAKLMSLQKDIQDLEKLEEIIINQ